MSKDTPIQHGEVTATYFWDDGSGINGDTGAPASGEPMQKGLFSSPSWPLGTEGYIVYEGKKAEFFIGDRGPGAPSQGCDVLLDMDGKTFAEITGETWDESSYTVSGGNGHLEVEYYITEWGDGHGTEGAPHPFQQPGNKCEDAVSPIPEEALPQEEQESAGESGEKPSEEPSEEATPEKDTDGGSGQDAARKEQTEEGAADDGEGDDGGDGGVTAETAANDLSGFQLMGSDGVMGGTGLLALALIPALLIALFFAWTRRPTGAHAGADDEGGRLTAPSSGRHSLGSRLSSVVDRLRGR
ncbi:hypothetical protein A6A08_03975 [Nocardiopsis sp. TSRI0078]|uniref:hypothetical protein n=1 Tax=unclassified Nocardiopsis TaxID=2649073 RepID=UPI00093B54D7|nr:hypothetical protein [Nocardiopsis sp. TSRI0078]OKI18793.1 hypothetical protein A6A08_03975 [Nocardiopsis sp. TSRI0078]